MARKTGAENFKTTSAQEVGFFIRQSLGGESDTWLITLNTGLGSSCETGEFRQFRMTWEVAWMARQQLEGMFLNSAVSQQQFKSRSLAGALLLASQKIVARRAENYVLKERRRKLVDAQEWNHNLHFASEILQRNFPHSSFQRCSDDIGQPFLRNISEHISPWRKDYDNLQRSFSQDSSIKDECWKKTKLDVLAAGMRGIIFWPN